MALVNLMESAANYSFFSPWDVDFTPMNDAWGNTYVSLIYADMGQLKNSIEYLNRAKASLNKFDDDTDLTIIRSDIKTLNIGFLKNAIGSAIHEYRELDNMDPELKYTSGWWGQVQKKSESLGASDVFMGDMADQMGGKRLWASGLWFIPLLAGVGTYLAGVDRRNFK